MRRHRNEVDVVVVRVVDDRGRGLPVDDGEGVHGGGISQELFRHVRQLLSRRLSGLGGVEDAQDSDLWMHERRERRHRRQDLRRNGRPIERDEHAPDLDR